MREHTLLHDIHDESMPLPGFNGPLRRVAEVGVIAAMLLLAAVSLGMVAFTFISL